MTKLEIITQLNDIFYENGWPVGKRIYEKKYSKIVELMVSLNEDEQKVLLTLVKDFIYIPHEKYPYYTEECFNKIDVDKYNGHNYIYVVPLKKLDQTKETKSGDSLAYSIANEYAPLFFDNGKKTVKILQKIRTLEKLNKTRKPSLFIFVDDFVGTGDTAFETVKLFNDSYKKKGDATIIVSIITMQTGYDRLKNEVDEFVSSIIVKKGITDSERIADKAHASKVMTGIEDKLCDIDDLRFGYKKSEALVSLVSTPDNTFPVFWVGKDANGNDWPAPFLRDK